MGWERPNCKGYFALKIRQQKEHSMPMRKITQLRFPKAKGILMSRGCCLCKEWPWRAAGLTETVALWIIAQSLVLTVRVGSHQKSQVPLTFCLNPLNADKKWGGCWNCPWQTGWLCVARGQSWDIRYDQKLKKNFGGSSFFMVFSFKAVLITSFNELVAAWD